MIIGILGPSRSGKDTAGEVIARTLEGTCMSFAAPMKAWCERALGLSQVWGSQKIKEAPLSRVARRKMKASFNAACQQGIGESLADFGTRTPLIDMLDMVCGIQLAGGSKPGEVRHRGNALRCDRERELASWWSEIHREKTLTPRLILQTFGTEFGRRHLGRSYWRDIGLLRAERILSCDGPSQMEGEPILCPTFGYNAVVFTDVRFRNEVVGLKCRGAKILRLVRPSLERGESGRRSRTVAKHASENEQTSIPDWWCDGVIVNAGTRQNFQRAVENWTMKRFQKPGTLHILA